MAEEFFPLWWIFPSAVIFSTVAVSSGVSGALFFSPFFMLVVGLTPVQAVGAGLLTEVFGMGNGLRSYVQSKLVDYATARWLLLGSIPTVVVGALVADRLPSTMLKAIFGGGLVVLGGFLVLVRSPEECEPGDRAVPLIDRRSAGRGTTVISARDGRVYEYPTCWRAPGIMLAAVGGLFTGLISAGLPEISTTQLVIRCRVPPRVAVATSVFTLAIVALAGATIHALAASPPPACRGLEHSRRARREYHRQPRGVVHSGSPHGEGARCTIRSGRCPRPGSRVRHVTRPARAPEVGHRQPEEGRADVERQIAQDVRGEALGFSGSDRIVSQLYAQTEPRAIAHRRADPDLKRRSLTRRPGWLRARSY